MFCTNCGKKISNQSKFCPFCGHATGLSVPPVQPDENETMVIMPSQNPAEGGIPDQVPSHTPAGGMSGVSGQSQGNMPAGGMSSAPGRGVAPINPNSRSNETKSEASRKSKPTKKAKKSGGKGALIAFIIVALVAVLAAALLAYMMFFGKDAGNGGKEDTKKETVIDDGGDKVSDEDSDGDSSKDVDDNSGSGEKGEDDDATGSGHGKGGEEESREEEGSGNADDNETESAQIPTLEPLTRPMDLASFSHAGASEATESSFMQAGYEAWKVLDSNDNTSWQDGIDGPGIGETLDFTLDREYEIRYLTFKLGNWFEGDYYMTNDRPKTLTITLGDQAWQVTFPDEQKEHIVEIPLGVKTDKVEIQIDEVYAGSQWDDTCITEFGIFAVNDGLGWQKEDGSWRYYTAPGEYAVDWLEWNKQWYYLLQDGTIAVGWLQILEDWYYFWPDGRMQVGWLQDNGKWYYCEESGHMKKGFMPITTNEYVYPPTGEVSHYGEGYYFLQDGSMYVGELLVWADGYSTPQQMQRYAARKHYDYVELSDADKAQMVYPTTGMSEVFYSFTADGQYNCRWVNK